METCCSFVFFFYQQLVFFLSIHETPERLHGLENAMRARINKALSGKWLQYHLWANYPFNDRGWEKRAVLGIYKPYQLQRRRQSC